LNGIHSPLPQPKEPSTAYGAARKIPDNFCPRVFVWTAGQTPVFETTMLASIPVNTFFWTYVYWPWISSRRLSFKGYLLKTGPAGPPLLFPLEGPLNQDFPTSTSIPPPWGKFPSTKILACATIFSSGRPFRKYPPSVLPILGPEPARNLLPPGVRARGHFSLNLGCLVFFFQTFVPAWVTPPPTPSNPPLPSRPPPTHTYSQVCMIHSHPSLT